MLDMKFHIQVLFSFKIFRLLAVHFSWLGRGGAMPFSFIIQSNILN
jgi:hypothetical protein